MTLTDWFGVDTPIIGMVHLEALPGAPEATDSLETVLGHAVRDAERLATGGVDGLMIENYGNTPFYPESVPKHTVAAMTRIGTAVTSAVGCPVGINVLRNDAEAALSVAAAVGADYIRVNVHTGASVTDQGVLEGRAHETLRLRDRLGVDVNVFADVAVKHATPLAGEQSVESEVGDLVDRGLADAVIVSGPATGRTVDTETLDQVTAVRSNHGLSTPILVGSGVTTETVTELLATADGAIVGTALKEGGQTTNPVDVDRVERLMNAVRALREQ
jgi:hypothetical protein